MDNYLNSQNLYAEPFNCNNGCQNASFCEFNNNVNTTNQYQPLTAFTSEQYAYSNNADFTNSVRNCDDGVVPSYQRQLVQNDTYDGKNNNTFSANVSSVSSFGENENYFLEQSYTPCRGPRPWNFAECFGFYGDAPCQYANVSVDMEDFM